MSFAIQQLCILTKKKDSFRQFPLILPYHEEIDIQIKGRHDPCVVPRAVPIVEAMAAITVLDYYLQYKAEKH